MSAPVKISEFTEKQASQLTGNELLPFALSGANYSVKVSELVKYVGSEVQLFDIVAELQSGDSLIADSPSSGAVGQIAYVTGSGANVFAFQVANEDHYNYYKVFTNDYCHTGAAKVKTIYICKSTTSVWGVINDTFTQLTSDYEIGVFNVTDFLSKTGQTVPALEIITDAAANIPAQFRMLGLIVTYKDDDGKWTSWQYIGSNVSGWATASNWTKLGTSVHVGEEIEDITDIL